ncbi:hypothetical protein B0G80_0392 [Paraburkholderia sp. BL6669N2]|nr:hypothetical protein B0G80_0392 [Paraburkholderia sp. BL6669N2]
MSTYAIVENGIVVNVILWDGNPEWSPPEGTIANLLPSGSSVSTGFTFDGTNYAAPTSQLTSGK